MGHRETIRKRTTTVAGTAWRAAMMTLVVCLMPISAVVARDGLYAPSRPEDAALVRAVNASSGEYASAIDIGPLRIESLAPGEASPYHLVPAGVYMIGGQGGTVFTPEGGSFVTIVTGYDPGDSRSIRLFEDVPHDDPARGQLVLYNLTDRELSLVAIRPETTVFEAVSAGESAAIAVNAVTVQLEIRDDQGAVAEHTVALVRGGSHALFASSGKTDESGAPDKTLHVFTVEASVSDE